MTAMDANSSKMGRVDNGYMLLIRTIFGDDSSITARSPKQVTPSGAPVLPLGNPEGKRPPREDPYKELAERINPRRG